MPFKSKAQRRFFYAAESRGELPRGTARRWEKETPKGKKLPDKVKQAAFDQGVRDGMAKVAARQKKRNAQDIADDAIGGAIAGTMAAGVGSMAMAPGQWLLERSFTRSPSDIHVTDAYFAKLRDHMGAGNVEPRFIKNPGESGFGFKWGSRGRSRFVQAPRQGAEFMAHELGHAVRFKNQGDKRTMLLSNLENTVLPAAGVVAGGAMAMAGEEGSWTTRLAPAVTAASFLPNLVDEAGASIRGYRALKATSGASAKSLQQARRNLYKAFGTYGLGALGATAGVGAIAAMRWNKKPSGAPDKGKKGKLP